MSLGIEYDMVLLPPRHMADAQEQRDFRPCSPRRGRRRRNNCTTAAPHAQLSPPRLTNDANSLVRDLTNVSIMPGTSAATCVAASPTLLASPPMAWGAPALPAPYTIGRVTPALLAPPPTSWEAPASPRQEVSAPSLARGEPSVFNPIPIQPSFNTSAFTSMYANLPFPSGCLHLEEKDGPGPGLDLSGLCDHEAMLQFLFACNELLFDGSDDYSTNEEGYNPSRECFHAEHKEHDEGNQLNMPREDNAPPHTPGNQGSRVCLRPPPPPRGHMAHIEQLHELHAKLGGKNNNGYNIFDKFLGEAAGRAPDGGARAKARDVYRCIMEDAEAEGPRPFTGPVRTSSQ
jgi:hypothetical protein